MTEPGVWCLSRYADVSAALRDRRLTPETPDGAVHKQFRESALSAFSATKIAEWRTRIEPIRFDGIAPWSLAVAFVVTGLPKDDAAELASMAYDVFASATEPFDDRLRTRSEASTTKLAARFRNAIDIQAFIALSQTLPCFLTNARRALTEFPEQVERLRDQSMVADAMEELLRYAGPSQAIFRTAREDVKIAGTKLPAGSRAMLALAAANRDPEQFASPNRLDFGRGAVRHLAFGGGLHACLGAQLIRMATAVAIPHLIDGLL
jgi:cytochrome P450